jgi:hypothetical protein
LSIRSFYLFAWSAESASHSVVFFFSQQPFSSVFFSQQISHQYFLPWLVFVPPVQQMAFLLPCIHTIDWWIARFQVRCVSAMLIVFVTCSQSQCSYLPSPFPEIFAYCLWLVILTSSELLKPLFGCMCIHLNSYMLEWIVMELSLIPLQHMWIEINTYATKQSLMWN